MSRDDHGSLVGALALAGAAGAAHAAPALSAPLPALRPLLGVDDRVRASRGVALTFDDGPHPRGTPAVLEALAARDARATFFLVGEQVRRDPALAAEVVAAGHRVALHCDRHRNLLRLAPWQASADLGRARATIEDACGVAVELYRPPYGVLSAAALGWARRAALRTLLWTHWGRDWEARATPASIAELLTRRIGQRSVMLLHDADDYSAPGSWERTVAALPLVFAELERRELSLVDP